MASAYLTRTQTTGNRTTFTFSAWVKRSGLGEKHLISCGTSSTSRTQFHFNGDNALMFYNNDGGSINMYIKTNRLFRDVNGWYHIVLRFDTTQATASDRIRFYVNGEEETSLATNTIPSQNADNTQFNYNGVALSIGRRHYDNYGHFDGSMSHVHFCDGQSYDASAFGESDSNGVWIPKPSPSVTYGTNGFFLKMDNSGNMGLDSSGQSNNLTTNGTITQAKDTPSNVFATLNPLHMDDPTANYFLSNGNLRQNVTNNDGHRQTGFTLHPKGLKGYFEVKCTVDPNFHLGLQNVTSRLLNTNYYTQSSPNYYFLNSSNPVTIQYANGGSAATYIANLFSQISVGDIIGCAFDFTGTNKNVWFHKNGTYGNNGSGVGNPATGAYPAMTSTQLTADEYEFIASPNTGSGNGQLDFNFGNGYFGTTAVSSAGTNASGNGIFEYDVPTGYTALSTEGLNS